MAAKHFFLTTIYCRNNNTLLLKKDKIYRNLGSLRESGPCIFSGDVIKLHITVRRRVGDEVSNVSAAGLLFMDSGDPLVGQLAWVTDSCSCLPFPPEPNKQNKTARCCSIAENWLKLVPRVKF